MMFVKVLLSINFLTIFVSEIRGQQSTYVVENSPGCVNNTVTSWNIPPGYSIFLLFNTTVQVCILAGVEGGDPFIQITTDYQGRISCGVDVLQKYTFICFTNAVTVSDAGVYTAKNVTDSATSNKTLFVMRPPTKPVISLQGDLINQKQHSLTCTANSTSVPDTGLLVTYTWTLGGAAITDPRFTTTGSGNSVLMINPVQKQDRGKRIQCTAKEDKGVSSAASDETILDVMYVPEISVNLSNRVAILGDNNVEFVCNVVDTNPAIQSLEWTKGGSQISTNPTYTIATVQKSDDGTYKCTANNSVGTSQPATVTLDVQYPPTVSSLTNRDIIEGRDLTITCSVTNGNPSQTTVYWTKSADSGFRQNGATLNITKINRSSSGTYTCTAENTYTVGGKGTASQSVGVNVLYPPTVSPMTNRDIIEGSDLTITCSVSNGNPSQTTVYWTKSGDSGFRQNGATLQITEINRSSAGTYTCTAENTYSVGGKGTGSHPVDVNVLYPPVIQDGSTITVNESQRVTLTRTISSNPASNTSWYSGGVLLHTQMSVDTAVLIIENAWCTSTGNYTLIANNGITRNDSTQVELLVNCKPETKANITLGITDEIGIEFSTTLIAYPQPRYTLYNVNKTIIEKMTSRFSRNAVNNFTITYNKTSVQQTDYGVYLLEITNTFGTSDIYINIIPQRKPNAPEVLRALCDMETAEVTWKSSFNGGDAQTFTVIALVAHQSVSQSSSVTDKGVNEEHKATVSGLKPSVTYVFNVSASNTHGETLSMKGVSCKTSDKGTNVAAVVGGAAAGGVSLALIVIILVVFLRRYKMQGKHAGSTRRLNDDIPEDNSADDDGLKENALYVSADIANDEKPGPSEMAVYAEVKKKSPGLSDNNANVYAEVKKTGPKVGEVKATNGAAKPKKGLLKKDEKPKQKKGKKQKLKQDVPDVYENSEDIAMKQRADDVYSNTGESRPSQQEQRGYKNQDGLLYVEVQFDAKKDNGKSVIHGEEEKTDYATVEFPFPPPSQKAAEGEKKEK